MSNCDVFSQPAIEFRGDGTYWDQGEQKFISQAEAHARTGFNNISAVYLLPSTPDGELTETSWDVISDRDQSLSAIDTHCHVTNNLLPLLC